MSTTIYLSSMRLRKINKAKVNKFKTKKRTFLKKVLNITFTEGEIKIEKLINLVQL